MEEAPPTRPTLPDNLNYIRSITAYLWFRKLVDIVTLVLMILAGVKGIIALAATAAVASDSSLGVGVALTVIGSLALEVGVLLLVRLTLRILADISDCCLRRIQ